MAGAMPIANEFARTLREVQHRRHPVRGIDNPGRLARTSMPGRMISMWPLASSITRGNGESGYWKSGLTASLRLTLHAPRHAGAFPCMYNFDARPPMKARSSGRLVRQMRCTDMIAPPWASPPGGSSAGRKCTGSQPRSPDPRALRQLPHPRAASLRRHPHLFHRRLLPGETVARKRHHRHQRRGAGQNARLSGDAAVREAALSPAAYLREEIPPGCSSMISKRIIRAVRNRCMPSIIGPASARIATCRCNGRAITSSRSTSSPACGNGWSGGISAGRALALSAGVETAIL